MLPLKQTSDIIIRGVLQIKIRMERSKLQLVERSATGVMCLTDIDEFQPYQYVPHVTISKYLTSENLKMFQRQFCEETLSNIGICESRNVPKKARDLSSKKRTFDARKHQENKRLTK